jgi:ribonuclease Z
MTSSTLLQLGGQAFLFDAGEGLQRQLMFTRQRPSDVTKVFITHMHADHVLGLPGLLLMAQLTGRACSTKRVVEIYGPPGIYNYIATIMALTRAHLPFIQLVVYELVGGDADQECRRHLRKPSFSYSHYPELSNIAITRKRIERNGDGTWTIQKPNERTRDDDFDVDRGGSRPMYIHAAEVKHLRKVQTFGYAVQEPEPSRKIDAEKAIKIGVAPGTKYRKLKNGFPVMSDDGISQVQPEQVLAGAVRKARKFACIGDNCGLSPAMIELCMDTDVLVHEATISVENATVSLLLCFVFLLLRFCFMSHFANILRLLAS